MLAVVDVHEIQCAEEAGYVLLSEDDGQEIYGRDDLPSTVEFDGTEWTLHLRDFNLDLEAHQGQTRPATDPPRPGPRPENRLLVENPAGGRSDEPLCCPLYGALTFDGLAIDHEERVHLVVCASALPHIWTPRTATTRKSRQHGDRGGDQTALGS